MAILELPSEDQPLDASAPRPQTTDTVFMIRPATTFRCNEETMGDNAFQHEIVPEGVDFSSPEAIAGFQTEFHARVLREFDAFVETLRSNGVNVVVVQDTEIPDTPDAVFPNNWVSLHHGGIQVRYPMKAPNRRLERELAPDVFGALTHAGHDYPTEVDLTSNELSDFPQALEGTLKRLNFKEIGKPTQIQGENTSLEMAQTEVTKLRQEKAALSEVVKRQNVEIDREGLNDSNHLTLFVTFFEYFGLLPQD